MNTKWASTSLCESVGEDDSFNCKYLFKSVKDLRAFRELRVYIVNSHVSYFPPRTLWPSAAGLLGAPHNCQKRIVFDQLSPKLWNTLPWDIRDISSLHIFEFCTFLFCFISILFIFYFLHMAFFNYSVQLVYVVIFLMMQSNPVMQFDVIM